MYADYETEISKEHLTTVFSQMKEPVCLLGGWAVFLTVNERFNMVNGRNYIGSRDIDLGFHVDPKWSAEELQNSALVQSVKILKDDRKFFGLGSRFVKYYDIETHEELTEEQAKKKRSYEMFQLFVDPLVDNTHKEAQKIIGFPLLDEPLLSHVFAGKRFTFLEEFGGKFMLPTPEVLVATKVTSAPKRTKDDKRIKDIADIYALLWHSDVEFRDLVQVVQKMLGAKIVSDVITKFTENDYDAVSNAIGIEANEVSRVVGELAK